MCDVIRSGDNHSVSGIDMNGWMDRDENQKIRL